MRNNLDAYYSPSWYGDVLRSETSVKGCVLEPCVGDGAIANKLLEWCTSVTTNDINPEVTADTHMDALALTGSYDWVVTNPPFSQSTAIVQKSMELAKLGVAMFLRHTWDEASDKHAQWLHKNPYSYKVTLPRFKFKRNKNHVWTTDFTTISLYVWEFYGAGTKLTSFQRSYTLPKQEILTFYDHP